MSSPQFWLAAVICSFVGLRLANRYQLPGLVGLGTGLGICVLIELDIWGGVLEVVLSSFLALSPFQVFVLLFSLLYAGIGLAVAAFGKTTVLAYMKLSSVVFSISIVSVGLPKYGPGLMAPGGLASASEESVESGEGAEGGGVGGVGRVRGGGGVGGVGRVRGGGEGFASQLLAALRSRASAEYSIGKVSADTPLYYFEEGRPKETSVHVTKGTWVRVVSQHRNQDGAVWLEVQAPDADGHFSPQSESGLLHESRIEETTTIPLK
jgi:hypothetical protein